MSVQKVRVNERTGRFIDIDLNKANRQALELKNYILHTYTPSNDVYDVIGQVLPLCELVLSGGIKEAVDVNELPLRYHTREGLLPNDLDVLFSELCLTITGTPRRFPLYSAS
ncbi:hypothetical protein [Agarivorans gilvus]|uniref:Uncharacterized protein n=1 Tax=Agarivorans gilvus TaxID=680279 RepID=A0ABQ1I6W0_9ALTE|nr:hypothetical protein [Agarivorans gilvus]GGB22391.1 hypothetical protein GCM10007414_39670 [Agarivorans gilvus]